MQQLRVGIDGYNLAMPNGTGIATYGLTLAGTLQRAGHRVEGVFGLDVGRDRALREIMFFDLLGREEPTTKPRGQVRRERWRLRRAALRPFLARQADEVPLSDRVEKSGYASRLPSFDRLVSSAHLFQIAFLHFRYYKRLLRLRMDNPPDIMHWTYPVPVELIGARNIYTLHDVVPLRLPYTTLDAKGSYHGIVQRCVERAAHVCTVSESSRADIISEFGIDPARITNTYQASPMATNLISADPADDAAMIEGIFGVPRQGYFLFFGAIEPKKNLGRLLEAYLSIQSETPLVIVGARAWQSESELRLLRNGAANPYARSASERIIQLEYLPRALLLRLIRSAKAVLFPSLYEGFGLPALEAMQLGTPVLTSQTSALPEVAGEAALFVDPYDVASIAAGLKALDRDSDLRARLAALGVVQAAKFSEPRYRQRIEDMYAGIVASAR